ncbi:MAG: NAD-dependent epimerase/dehydratase family protein [Promethearchaeota archaeon]
MVFITGGTGFIGSKVCSRLVGEGCVALVRRGSTLLKSLGFRQVVGDLRDSTSYKAVLDECDVVIHLAADVDEMSKSLWAVNVAGTKALIDACTSQRMVYLSTADVYGEFDNPHTENSQIKPETEYERNKAEAERIIVGSGLPFTILRSTLVYGSSSYWKTIIKMIQKGFPMIENGGNYFHTVFVEDLAGVVVKSMQKKYENEVFNIAGDDVLTFKQTYETIKDVLGIEKKTKRIPIALAYMMSYFLKLVPGSIFIPAHVKRLVRNRLYDTSKAQENGLSCPTPFKDGIRKIIDELGFGEL